MRRALSVAALMAMLLGLSACENMNNHEQRVLSGGAMGAAGGAALTALTGGSIWLGTAIGGAAGAAAGHLTSDER